MPQKDPEVLNDAYQLRSVKSLTYLGSCVNANATLDNELSFPNRESKLYFWKPSILTLERQWYKITYESQRL